MSNYTEENSEEASRSTFLPFSNNTYSLPLEEINHENERNSISSSGSEFYNWVPFGTPIDYAFFPVAEASSTSYNSYNFHAVLPPRQEPDLYKIDIPLTVSSSSQITSTSILLPDKSTHSSQNLRHYNGSVVTSSSCKSPPKKTDHKVIEKRYRANLNNKLAELRDVIPNLHAAVQDSEEEVQGSGPPSRLKKAMILSKAIEYIAHLEQLTKALSKEIDTLKSIINPSNTPFLDNSSRIPLDNVKGTWNKRMKK